MPEVAIADNQRHIRVDAALSNHGVGQSGLATLGQHCATAKARSLPEPVDDRKQGHRRKQIADLIGVLGSGQQLADHGRREAELLRCHRLLDQTHVLAFFAREKGDETARISGDQ